MDFLFNIPEDDIVYDFETFPNAFTAYFECLNSNRSWYFEVSSFRNDVELFILFMSLCGERKVRWIGYNNEGFDYPIAHFINLYGTYVGCDEIYQKAMQIINTPWNRRFDQVIWADQRIVDQVDLFKIHHFDNPSKSTKLKALEFCMRSKHVQDLPFPVGKTLTREEVAVLKEYNINDVRETKQFAHHSKPAIELRDNLSRIFNTDMTNSNDVKIGEKILIDALEKKGVQCYVKVDGQRKKLQTQRDVIKPSEIIFPTVKFVHPLFNYIHRSLLEKEIEAENTKGVFDDLVANVGGIEYKFGTGGLHGSVENRIVRESKTHALVDVDVASYYPNLGIKNRLYPEHLGRQFCDAYDEIYHTRRTFPKGTPENESYKLALNGAYGGTNNKYSPLYDPQYTMTITLNGQLLLAMLIDQMIRTPGLEMIQANTDGITYLCPRKHLDHTQQIIKWWEELTNLELEEAHYESMFVRDVNSYIAVGKDGGKVKRIGAYAYTTAAENPGTRELPWHKDWSFRVVQMAAEAYLLHGTPIERYLAAHTDVYDFFGRTKVNNSTTLLLGGEEVPGIIRYYISNAGARLEKVMPVTGLPGAYKRANKLTDEFYRATIDELIEIHNPPGDTRQQKIAGLPWDERINFKSKTKWEEQKVTALQSGWNVTMINHWDDDNPTELDLNYDFYIQEAKKLVNLQEKV